MTNSGGLETTSRPKLKFPCLKNCGKCCTIVPFTTAEKNAAKKVKNVAFRRDRKGRWWPKEGLEDRTLPCPYLDEDKNCTVYATRPLICRVFGLSQGTSPCPAGVTTSKVYANQTISDLFAIYLKRLEDPTFMSREIWPDDDQS